MRKRGESGKSLEDRRILGTHYFILQIKDQKTYAFFHYQRPSGEICKQFFINHQCLIPLIRLEHRTGQISSKSYLYLLNDLHTFQSLGYNIGGGYTRLSKLPKMLQKPSNMHHIIRIDYFCIYCSRSSPHCYHKNPLLFHKTVSVAWVH